MTIQNAVKLLQQISKLEEKIAEIQALASSNAIELEDEVIIQKLFTKCVGEFD